MQATQQGIALPKTPPGRRLFAIGDIHGRLDLLEKLLERIAEHALNHPHETDILVFLGDYVDRGPSSRAVIERLSGPAPMGFERVCLKGNHEDLMLTFLEGEAQTDLWLRNGGRDTLKSYGVDIPGAWGGLFSEYGAQKARTALLEEIPDSHVAFLTGLSLMHQEGDYVFVHAGVRPGVSLDKQEESDLIWIRGDFLGCADDFGKIVVHGHSVTTTPSIENNRIGIDTGAWRSDLLTCLVLEGENRQFITT